MNVGHDSTDAHDAVASNGDRPAEPEQLPGEYLGTATRILVESHSRPECETCEADIDHGVRFKCVTIRGRDGRVRDLSYCSEECVRRPE
jgi:hypothetical protein